MAIVAIIKALTPKVIGKMSAGQVAKTYSRYRSIAEKRVARMEKQGLGRDLPKFKTIKEIKGSNKVSLQSQLADVSKFLSDSRNTVKGQKVFLNNVRDDMIKMGYGDLVQTNDQIYNMIDFMNSMREQYTDKLFDSGDALDVLEQGERLNIPNDKLKENYDLFAGNLDKLEQVRPSKGGREFSQQRIDNLINKWE